jgi:hypothetical protein
MALKINNILMPIVRTSPDDCNPNLWRTLLFSAFSVHVITCSAPRTTIRMGLTMWCCVCTQKKNTKVLASIMLLGVMERRWIWYLRHRCSVCIEYLDYSLKMFFKRRANTLMVNCFILMSWLEIVTQSRIHGIPYFTFCITLRWLAPNTCWLWNYHEGADKYHKQIKFYFV